MNSFQPVIVSGDRAPVPERYPRLRGYWVSRSGRLYDHKGRLVQWTRTVEGVCCVVARYRDRWECYPAARIVYEAFRGPVARGLIVVPLNGKQGDLQVSNVLAMTKEEAARIAKGAKPPVERPEEWRPVPLPGAELYEVSDQGRVRNRSTKRELQRVVRGSVVANLSIGGKRSSRGVRSLVAGAFIGPAPEGCTARSIDGDTLNVSLANTAYRQGSKAGPPPSQIDLGEPAPEPSAPEPSAPAHPAQPKEPAQPAQPSEVKPTYRHPGVPGDYRRGSPKRRQLIDTMDVWERFQKHPHPKRDKAYAYASGTAAPPMPDALLHSANYVMAYLSGPKAGKPYHELFMGGQLVHIMPGAENPPRQWLRMKLMQAAKDGLDVLTIGPDDYDPEEF